MRLEIMKKMDEFNVSFTFNRSMNVTGRFCR